MVALTCTLDDDNAWIIDNGASRHMIGESRKLHTLSRQSSIKGLGSTSLKLDSGAKIQLNNIIYVPGFKNNLISISFLKDKGDRFAFVYGKVFVWGKGSSIRKTKVIGVREGRLYRVITPSPQSLVHMEINPINLWHSIYWCIH